MPPKLNALASVALCFLGLAGCRGPQSPIDGEWEMVSYVDTYWHSRARAEPPEIATTLRLSRGQFRVSSAGADPTTGFFTIGDERTATDGGGRGPSLELSVLPPELQSTLFVLQLQGDSLRLLTTVVDGNHYTFVRRK
jgi:hypothetical protein